MIQTISDKIFSGYPDALKKIMIESDSYAGGYISEAYYKPRIRKFGVYPNTYVGKNIKDVISRIVVEYSSNIKFLSFKHCRYCRMLLNSESYEYSDEVQDRGMSIISLNVNGYKISLCYAPSLMKESVEFGDHAILYQKKYQAAFKGCSEIIRSMNTTEFKEYAVRDFIDMCRGKNV